MIPGGPEVGSIFTAPMFRQICVGIADSICTTLKPDNMSFKVGKWFSVVQHNLAISNNPAFTIEHPDTILLRSLAYPTVAVAMTHELLHPDHSAVDTVRFKQTLIRLYGLDTDTNEGEIPYQFSSKIMNIFEDCVHNTKIMYRYGKNYLGQDYLTHYISSLEKSLSKDSISIIDAVASVSFYYMLRDWSVNLPDIWLDYKEDSRGLTERFQGIIPRMEGFLDAFPEIRDVVHETYYSMPERESELEDGISLSEHGKLPGDLYAYEREARLFVKEAPKYWNLAQQYLSDEIKEQEDGEGEVGDEFDIMEDEIEDSDHEDESETVHAFPTINQSSDLDELLDSETGPIDELNKLVEIQGSKDLEDIFYESRPIHMHLASQIVDEIKRILNETKRVANIGKRALSNGGSMIHGPALARILTDNMVFGNVVEQSQYSTYYENEVVIVDRSGSIGNRVDEMYVFDHFDVFSYALTQALSEQRRQVASLKEPIIIEFNDSAWINKPIHEGLNFPDGQTDIDEAIEKVESLKRTGAISDGATRYWIITDGHLGRAGMLKGFISQNHVIGVGIGPSAAHILEAIEGSYHIPDYEQIIPLFEKIIEEQNIE